MTPRTLLGALPLGAWLLGAWACGSDGGSGVAPVECPAGSETCPCYGNLTCDAGLSCFSGRCVDANSTGSGGSSTEGGQSGSGGSSSDQGGSKNDAGGKASSGGSNAGGSSAGGSKATGGTSEGGSAPEGGADPSGGTNEGGSANAEGGSEEPGGAPSQGGSGTGGGATGGSDGNGGSMTGGTTGTGGSTSPGELPFFDDFEDGADPGWTGQGWAVTSAAGSNVFTRPDNGGGVMIGNLLWEDQRVELRFRIESTGSESWVMLGARYQQGTQASLIYLYFDGTVMAADNYVEGLSNISRSAELTSVAPLVVGEWYTLGLEIVGSTLTAFFEGEDLGGMSDLLNYAGGIALDFDRNGTVVYFDDVSVVEP